MSLPITDLENALFAKLAQDIPPKSLNYTGDMVSYSNGVL